MNRKILFLILFAALAMILAACVLIQSAINTSRELLSHQIRQGCCVYVITNISLLYSSHLLVRRFASDSPASVRLVATGTCYYACIVLIVQALSPFHAISKTGVTLVALPWAVFFMFSGATAGISGQTWNP